MTETAVLFHSLKQRMSCCWTQKAHVRNVKRHRAIQYPVIKLTILQSRTLPVLLLSLLIAPHLLALLQEFSQLARKYRVILHQLLHFLPYNLQISSSQLLVLTGKLPDMVQYLSMVGVLHTKRCMLLLQLSSIWLWSWFQV